MTIGLFWTIFAGFIGGILMNGFVPLKRLAGMRGMLVLCMVGVMGALVASFAGQALQLWNSEQLGAFLAAIVGAAVVLGGIAYFSYETKPIPPPV